VRYFPLSTIAQSPLMSPVYAWEVANAYHTSQLSRGAMHACGYVIEHTKPHETPLVIIESVGTPMRRVYIDYPETEAWLALERGGFVLTNEFFGFVVDALH